MYTAFGIVVILIAILLILIVIIQNPKGGMLNSSIGSIGNQILGAGRSTDTVEKLTWYLAGSLMILSILSVYILPDPRDVVDTQTSEGAAIQEALDKNKSASPIVPTAPIAPPAQQQSAAPQTENTAPAQ